MIGKYSITPVITAFKCKLTVESGCLPLVTEVNLKRKRVLSATCVACVWAEFWSPKPIIWHATEVPSNKFSRFQDLAVSLSSTWTKICFQKTFPSLSRDGCKDHVVDSRSCWTSFAATRCRYEDTFSDAADSDDINVSAADLNLIQVKMQAAV